MLGCLLPYINRVTTNVVTVSEVKINTKMESMKKLEITATDEFMAIPKSIVPHTEDDEVRSPPLERQLATRN